LQDYLGGKSVAGVKLKSKTGWKDNDGKDGNGTNSSGFTGLPGGCRNAGVIDFSGIKNNGMWWSATANPPIYAWDFTIYYHSDKSSIYFENQEKGKYVRCVKD
jgi:uncharacterized protein (TIGR02145 family)